MDNDGNLADNNGNLDDKKWGNCNADTCSSCSSCPPGWQGENCENESKLDVLMTNLLIKDSSNVWYYKTFDFA